MYTAPMDYEAVSDFTFNFTELEVNQRFCANITIVDDDTAEAPVECFPVVLSNVGPEPDLILNPSIASICIEDNDGMCILQY